MQHGMSDAACLALKCACRCKGVESDSGHTPDKTLHKSCEHLAKELANAVCSLECRVILCQRLRLQITAFTT